MTTAYFLERMGVRTGVDLFHDSNGFLGLGAHRAVPTVERASAGKPYIWVASGNQFFASILHPVSVESHKWGNFNDAGH
mgnify:CR=1 FL=1